MKKNILIGALSLGLAFGALGAVSASRVEYSKVDAAVTYVYSLKGDRATSNWSTDIVSCTDTGSGGSFTVELTEGEQIKIVITASGDETWNYWPGYTECISDSLSAYFSNSGGNYLVNVAGSYTFAFDAGWATYNDKHYGLTITPPEVSQRSVTYSRLFGTEGDYLADVTKSVVVGTETLTYADFAPDAVYGFTFDGFYSDAECKTSIPLTTEVTSDVASGVWARYLPTTGSVTYTFDYSAGMSTVWNSGYTLAYRYWNDSSNVAWPGIFVGGETNGTFTFSVPSDATGVQIVACDEWGNSKGETNGVVVAPATDTVHMVAIKDGGTADDYGYYKVTSGFLADEAYMTIYNALQTVADQCATSANLSAANEAITAAWTSIAEGVAAVPADLAHIKGVSARVDESGNRVDGLAGLVSVYDWCVSKYALTDPLDRVADPSAYNFSLADEDNRTYVIVIGVVGASLLGLGLIAISRKRKGKRAE